MAAPYACPHCRADFKTYARRQEHIEIAHQEVHQRKMRCTTCDEAFRAEMKWLDTQQDSTTT